jgi:hypothetical protein
MCPEQTRIYWWQGDSRVERLQISLESIFRFSEIFVAPKVAWLTGAFISSGFTLEVDSLRSSTYVIG